MNRLTVLVFATLPILPPAVSASGQTTLTVTGGLNMASVSASEPNDAIESVTRMALGLSAGFPVAEGWRVQLGAAYSQKGFAFGPAELGVDYIEFTGLLDRPLPLGDRASLHLLAGPALGIRMSCKTTFEERSQDCEVPPKDFDFGVAGGAEAEIGLSDGLALSVGAVYTLGLLNVSDAEGDEFLKNRTLTLRAGAVFPIG